MLPSVLNDFSVALMSKCYAHTNFIHDDMPIKGEEDALLNWSNDEEPERTKEDIYISLQRPVRTKYVIVEETPPDSEIESASEKSVRMNLNISQSEI